MFFCLIWKQKRVIKKDRFIKNRSFLILQAIHKAFSHSERKIRWSTPRPWGSGGRGLSAPPQGFLGGNPLNGLLLPFLPPRKGRPLGVRGHGPNSPRRRDLRGSNKLLLEKYNEIWYFISGAFQHPRVIPFWCVMAARPFFYIKGGGENNCFLILLLLGGGEMMIDFTELLLFTQVIIELAALFLALSGKDGKNKK